MLSFSFAAFQISHAARPHMVGQKDRFVKRGFVVSGGKGNPSSLLSMPVASFVATGTACGRHSVAAGA
ncbi:hypothetical protein, partial [uncultured Desulfovibrio sp.]|uniref:hypothetical protein n=1 Tax=uncultured Desulfovibrio sp. TaxID=167968 RepID=UPI0026290BBB